ncbi:hypothetical protein T10_12961 [Trichinella papuae]|uniref:Uncharacterized protein n=1 Tax=Trichinella papuae TaxID=268474 RepID=A0A0V1MBP2_9BILA|nr:hypothetical protein T10_12961 [Trichinella papuae]
MNFGLLQCCMHKWPWKVAAIPGIKFVSKLSCTVSLKRGQHWLLLLSVAFSVAFDSLKPPTFTLQNQKFSLEEALSMLPSYMLHLSFGWASSVDIERD